MTKKDFERIASVLAYCEAYAGNDAESEVVEWVAEEFSESFEADHPRFKPVFMVAALPLKAEKQKNKILETLGMES